MHAPMLKILLIKILTKRGVHMSLATGSYWVLIYNTKKIKENIMRSLFLASTSWFGKCLLLSQRNNKCKNCIKMKNVNIQLSFLIRDIKKINILDVGQF
jgi:hypothetical protein